MRRTRIRVALSLAFTATVILPTVTAAQNLLVNGSFEQGPTISAYPWYVTLYPWSTTLSGWTVIGSSIDYCGPNWNVSDGVRLLDLDGNNATGGVRQTFTTTPGMSYTVSFDLSGNPAGPPQIKQVRVSVDEVTRDFSFDTLGMTPATIVWSTRTFNFVASGSSATLSFMSLSQIGNSYGPVIDNVSVTPVGGQFVAPGYYIHFTGDFEGMYPTEQTSRTPAATEEACQVLPFYWISNTCTCGGDPRHCMSECPWGPEVITGLICKTISQEGQWVVQGNASGVGPSIRGQWDVEYISGPVGTSHFSWGELKQIYR